MDTESKPFEGEAETPESPHIATPPTCHVKESKGSGTSGVKSTSSDSTVPLLPDHPLTHTTPTLVLILPFCKRVRYSYDSSPSSTLSVRKRYRGTFELILDTDSEEDEEVEETSDSDSEREDAEDEGPTIEDENLAAGDEGLAEGDEGPSMGVKSRGLDDKGHSVESDGFSLGEEEAVLEGQGSGSAPEPERSERVSASRQPTLAT
uniref:Uncharacterized protein n=1 Tax=Tanacetum cinerariifolium TaxID=118510 RepID=A0A699K9Z0_TANCI|nr:hypothetical protein [Tanacetum cinerariifolium]